MAHSATKTAPPDTRFQGPCSPLSQPCVDPTATVRTCRRCGETKPLVAYRVRTRGTNYRAHTCDECYGIRDQIRARMRRGVQRRKVLAGSLTKIRTARRDSSVATVCELLLKEFGGPSGLAEAFATYHQHAKYQMRRNGRPNPLFKLMSAVTRLWTHCDARRETHLAEMSEKELHVRLREVARESASHSDEELQGRLESAVQRLAEADPDWVAGILSRAGWELTRQNTCNDGVSETMPAS